MLHCVFRFKAYAKNIKEKATERSFKTTEALKFHIYKSAAAPNCIKSHSNS